MSARKFILVRIQSELGEDIKEAFNILCDKHKIVNGYAYKTTSKELCDICHEMDNVFKHLKTIHKRYYTLLDITNLDELVDNSVLIRNELDKDLFKTLNLFIDELSKKYSVSWNLIWNPPSYERKDNCDCYIHTAYLRNMHI